MKRGQSCGGPPGPGKAEGSHGVEPSPSRGEALDSVPALLLTSRVTPGSRPRPLLSASSSAEWPVPASEGWREASISEGFSTEPGCTAHVNKGSCCWRRRGVTPRPAPTWAMNRAPHHGCRGRRPTFIRRPLIREAMSFHVVFAVSKNRKQRPEPLPRSFRGDSSGNQ